jgi:hypothetical protein
VKPAGDRRVNQRFEILGVFWAGFGVNEPVRVVNITPNGALLDSWRALPVESIQSVHLTVGGQVTAVDGRVRHLTPVPSNGRQERYLIGLEFVAPSSSFLESVERLTAPADQPAGSE